MLFLSIFRRPLPLFAAPPLAALLIAAMLLVSACSPALNWREVRGSDAPFSVLLPAKPATHARPIDLNGLKVTMNMTAAEANGVSFAVGSVMLADPAQHAKALAAMQTAMVRNIRGEIKREQTVRLADGSAATEIEAVGRVGKQGQAVLLAGRFAGKGAWVVQAVVIGEPDKLSREALETFLGSLRLTR